MRFTARMLANLVFVVTIGAIAVVWAAVELADFNPWAPPSARVYVTLPETGGALPGGEVTYLGVAVGKVMDAELVDDGVRLELEIAPEEDIAGDLRADVRQKTSLGEPYVDLGPASDDAQPVATEQLDGLQIPLSAVSVPPAIDALLRDFDGLISAIDPEELDTLVDGAGGLAGRGGELADTMAGMAAFAEATGDREVMQRLYASAARLTATLDSDRTTLDDGMTSVARLGGVLADNRDRLASLLDSAARAGTQGEDLLQTIEQDIPGVLDGLDTSVTTLAERPQSVNDILVWTPTFVTQIGKTFSGNAAWSSTQGVPGAYAPSYGLPVTGQGLRIDKIFLPETIRRLEIDGRGFPQIPALAIVSPEDWQEASGGPDPMRAVLERLSRDWARAER